MRIADFLTVEVVAIFVGQLWSERFFCINFQKGLRLLLRGLQRNRGEFMVKTYRAFLASLIGATL